MRHKRPNHWWSLHTTNLGGGGGGRMGHNLLVQFSSLSSRKMEISETNFFDTLTIQNDQISYAKHAFRPSLCVFLPLPLYIDQWTLIDECPLYVFFTLFGCLGVGAGSHKGAGAQPACAVFQPRSSLSPLRGALPKAIELTSPPPPLLWC